MQLIAVLFRCSVLCCVVWGGLEAWAQTKGAVSPAGVTNRNGAVEENPTPAELLESYRSLREQLKAAQMAIMNNRLEAEEAARVQAAALAVKLEAIKVSMAEAAERQKDEDVRLAYERDRREVEMQRMNRMGIWIASGLGVIGLLAMLIITHRQSKAMNRIADAVASHPQLMSQQAWLPGMEAAQQLTEAANRRLKTAIDRIDKRIMELEHISGDQEPAARPLRRVEREPTESQ